MGKKYECRKCGTTMNKDDKTTLKIKGVQNQTIHLCFGCLEGFNLYLDGKMMLKTKESR